MRRWTRHAGRALRAARSALALVAGSASAVTSQELRGTVRDSTSGQPLSGAVVLLLGEGGAPRTRTLTDGAGAYRVRRSPDTQRAEIRRIGFRPKIVPLPVPASVATLDVVVSRLPTLLEPVPVADRSRCPRRPDRATALGLWEQARAALLAAVVARDAAPARVVRLRFDRWMQGDSITSQRVTLDSADRTTRPFAAARTSEAFAREGFVGFARDADGPATFFAPDADVLLDEAFARAYCFRLADADPERPGEAGVAMTAATRAPGRVDIDATLWVDTVARALRAVAFRYVGTPAVERPARGGRVEFRTLDDGVPLIERWALRLAELRADTAYERTGARRVTSWFDTRQLGGELAEVVWADASRWRSPLGTLQLRAVRRDGQPAAGTRVRLVGSNYEAVVDSGGTSTIPYLLPGPYTIGVADPRLDPLDLAIPTPARFRAERDSVVHATIQVPTLDDFVAQLCLAERRKFANPLGGSAWLLARVVAADGRPADGVRWRLGGRQASLDADRDALAFGELGSTGVLPVCRSLVRGGDYTLRVWRPGEPAVFTPLAMTDRVTVVRIELDARARAAPR